MKPPPERKRFEYDQEAARQRFAFRDLINKAIKGKPQPLCEYLSSGPSLSHRDWYDLAEFIGRICPRIGRHPGPGDDMHFAIQAAAFLVKKGKKAWVAKHRCKNVPGKVTDLLIGKAIELAGVEIDAGQVREHLDKSRSTVAVLDRVDHDSLTEAIHTMIEFVRSIEKIPL
jgi:hypothetical protein